MTRAAATNATPASLANDARFDLAMAAARAERANRPTYLLIGAAALLIVALAALLWSWQAKSAAESKLATEMALGQQFVDAAQRLRELEVTPKSGPSASEPIPDMGSRMQAAAVRAGMAKDAASKLLPIPSRDSTRSGNAVRKKFQYNNVREATLEPLVSWLSSATEEVPGLKVYSLTLKPDATGWTMNVTFTRWERSGT